jgi:hypothetical protein
MSGGTLVQAWNEARPDELSTSVTGARVYGTVGVQIAEDCTTLAGVDADRAVRDQVAPDARFYAAARAMDHLPGAAATPDAADRSAV